MRRPVACLLAVCAFAGFATTTAGCGKRVTVVDPQTSIHLSGMWNDDDSKSVSSEMIDQSLKGAWITNFRDRTGRAPIVRVSTVVNKSNEEIATQIFTDDLEKALLNSGRVRVIASRSEAELQRDERADLQANSSKESAPRSAQEQASDFGLQGSIKIQHDRNGSNQVKFYQVDLKLIDITTNETVWIGSTERKKVVEN